jgi:LPXTG-motif cell wall-anchored protein
MMRTYGRFAVGFAVFAGTIGGLPGIASAAAADTAELAAVTEQNPQTGNNVRYPVKPGEVVPAKLGVTNIGDAAVDGLVVELRVLDDLDFATRYDNCWYAVDSNADEAWCEFDTSLAADATLALYGDIVRVIDNARPDKVGSIMFRWASKDWADERGGVQALADGFAGQGSAAVRGTESGLTLEPASLPLPAKPNALNFAYTELITPTPSPTPSSPAATTSPTTEPTASPTTSPTAGTPGDGGTGGGLPVTGAQSATLAGAGAGLLLLGAAGYLIARRRRTRFVS